MAEKHLLLGDRNHITLNRSIDIGDSRHLPGDTVIVDGVTAKSLIENHYGELTSLEFDKGPVQHGAYQQFRKK